MDDLDFPGWEPAKSVQVVEGNGLTQVLVKGQPYMRWQSGDEGCTRLALVQLYKCGLCRPIQGASEHRQRTVTHTGKTTNSKQQRWGRRGRSRRVRQRMAARFLFARPASLFRSVGARCLQRVCWRAAVCAVAGAISIHSDVESNHHDGNP